MGFSNGFGFSGGGGGGGGGTIGGGGTLNYIAKFTPDGTHIGNSLLFDDGTFVGIGTISPKSTLHNAGSTGLINDVSAAPSLTLDATKTIYVFSGTTTTWSLPIITGNVDRIYFIKNRGSGIITLNVTGGTSDIYSSSAVSSFVINPGEAYIISNDGTYWNIQ